LGSRLLGLFLSILMVYIMFSLWFAFQVHLPPFSCFLALEVALSGQELLASCFQLDWKEGGAQTSLGFQ
jgi:hypothetical protein